MPLGRFEACFFVSFLPGGPHQRYLLHVPQVRYSVLDSTSSLSLRTPTYYDTEDKKTEMAGIKLTALLVTHTERGAGISAQLLVGTLPNCLTRNLAKAQNEDANGHVPSAPLHLPSTSATKAPMSFN